ncbi:TAXI family TRAP transporter solute-binding subunit [Oceanicola sp. S124]|uniref:TAXI family TRAP transporter solute-binding subunit n=1 Tax=Oceanicola sp. S124 TaxID=1042378 RepID=UPI0002559680|nr:TAXI family TRAP transporter solute-binding subunit [Oceanicola sp. S124]
MTSFVRALAAATLVLTAGIAQADPLGIVTAKQGSSTYNLGLAMAKAGAEIGGLDLRPVPYQSTSQGSTFVNSGEVAFGLENSVAVGTAYLGKDKFAGNALENVRLVARLLPLRMSLGVRADSEIQSVADLRGKRLPSGFGAAVTGEMLVQAMLATEGLAYDDVKRVRVSNFTTMAETFAAGDLDAYIFVIGSPRDEKISQQVGGLRALDLSDSSEALAGVHRFLPVASLFDLAPDPAIQDIDTETTILQYDYFVYTSADTDDETVTALLRSLHGGKAMMEDSVASLRWFDPEAMNPAIGVPYHPAAVAFFQDIGS